MYGLAHSMDNANLKCKLNDSNEQPLCEVCGSCQQDKPANVSAELHSSSA